MRPLVCLVLTLVPTLALPTPASAQPVDVPYVPTPPAIVTAMLTIARVGPSDVVYDLGSGDGRIVIAAAKAFGARGVGIECNPALIAEARAAADRVGVGDRVRFVEQDFFTANIRKASVVTLYLLPAVNLRIRGKLRSELRPGTRVVSHCYAMGDWLPDFETEVDGRKIFYWVIR
jgi:SAM-dependent methyltransferase